MEGIIFDYVVIGNITRDITPQGAILGGTSSYAALAASRLNARVGMISAIGEDAPALDALSGVALQKVPCKTTATFENVYQDGSRRQKWLASGCQILPEHIPAAWQNARVVHLAPIAQELSPRLCAEFPNSLVGATVQGWLRGRDAAQNVIFQEHPAFWENIGHLDVLIASLSDFFGNRAALLRAVTSVPLGIETLGADGCAIYQQGKRQVVPVTPQTEVDPTGAGDVFAAAFLLEFSASGDSLHAAQFANACASLSVGNIGVSGAPTRHDTEKQCRAIYR